MTEPKCLCCSLRAGVFLIAFFDILIALLFMTDCSIRLVGNDYDFSEESFVVGYKSVDIVAIVLYSLLVFTAAILIIGAATKHPRAMKPWMITKTVLIVIGGILQIVYLSFVTVEYHTKATRFVMIMEAVTIIQIALGCYMISVVNNYYNVLTKPKEKVEEDPPQPPISVI